MMQRGILTFLCCLGFLASGEPVQSDVVIQDALITQTSGNYIYWNAEDFDRLEFPDGNPTWRVNFDPPGQSISGKTLRAQASGNSNGGDNDSFAIYDLNFTDPGDYTLYAFRLGGEGDSMFPPPDLGAVPFHDPTFGNSVNRWNGIDNNSWNELGDDTCCDSPGLDYYASGIRGAYTVAAAGTSEFTIEARENSAQYDRFVLHTSKGLSGAELDALTFSDAVVNTPLEAPPPPPVINFQYAQTDKDTGSGTLSGIIDGITFTGAMPKATVAQNDSSGLPVPAGMVGYMDGAANPSTSGNDFGVHVGFGGQVVTLQGEKDGLPYELDVPLVIAPDGTPDATWAYSADVTDDDGAGNDAFGEGFRIAGWIGEPTQGHRHSGATETFVQNAVDTFTMGGSHGQVDENGWGDNLGIGFSFRDGPTDGNGAFLDGSGPVYVDSITWQGGLTVDPSTIRLVPEPSGLTLICLSAFAIMRRRRTLRR